jgi:DNA-binding response OmpR family regulator
MPKKILVLEDDPYVADTLRLQLEAHGFEVDTASDGLEGLNRARADSPDLVLLEVVLPKLDGYHVCRLLKFDQQYRHIPIFILTGRQRGSDRKTGEAVGAEEYLVKPCDIDDLLGRIRQYLGENG